MMCLKRLSFALAVCLAASVPMWGQSAQVVYVGTGDSNVYAVAPGGAATQLIPSSNTSYSGAQFTSIAVGPDNTADNTDGNTYFFLYACDTANSNIVRLRLRTDSPGAVSGAVDTVYDGGGSLTAPVCGRVASNGDLYVSSANSGSGVYVLPGASTATGDLPLSATQVYDIGGSFTGGGIAQKNGGDMLVVNKAAGTILRAKFMGANPPNPPYSPFAPALDTSAFVSGLSSPSAIARISTGKFFVANQGAETVLRFDPANLSSPTTCSVNVPNGNVTLSSVAASEDNFVYVGIASTSQNKRVVQILNGRAANCGSVGSVSLSAVSATSVAAVAVPPVAENPISTDSNTDSAGITASTLNFGSSVVQTLTEDCTPTLTQGQMSIAYLNGLLPPSNGTSWFGGAAIPNNGEGGFGTVYTVTSSGCTRADVINNFLIGSLVDNTQFTNPRIIRCDTSVTGTMCSAIEASGTWPVGGLLSDDLTVGGKVPGFSQFFLANGNLSGSSKLATFCNFGSPLITTTDPSQASIFNSGQNLSVKFKLGAAGTADSCSNGPYITDARALLSVARVADGAGNPIFEPIAINSSGNSTTTEPTFSYNPNNQQYQFSLSLKNYKPGTYSLTVTFLTNNAPYQYTLFKVQ